MTYETQILLFVAVVVTYLILVGVLLHRELSVEEEEKHPEYQKTPRLPTDVEYFGARRLGLRRMLNNLPMAVRYHFERLRPGPANTGYQLANRGCLHVKPLPYSIIRGTMYVRLEEDVRYHFYKRFPAQQTEHGAIDSNAYSELEEQVRFHFHRLRTTLEKEHEPTG